jgi:hypothetical protein
MTLSALRISLRTGICSARPLIPDMERAQEVVVERSADGRGGAGTQEGAKDTNRSKRARQATATATAKRGRKGRSSANETEAERVSGKRRKQREIETSRRGGDTR